MMCSCPKCRADVQLDLPEVTEQGSSVSCPDCKCRFTVRRESFGGRALRKAGEITCASCHHRLGPSLQCAGCGALFPDYLVSTVGRAKKRAVQKIELKGAPFSPRKIAPIILPKLGAPQPKEATPRPQGAKAPMKKYGRLLVALALLIALGAGGATFYTQHKNANEFSNNFVVAIYCTRVGEKKSIETCGKIAEAWKAKGEVGQTPPRAGVEDLRELDILQSKLDDTLRKIEPGKAPKELRASMEKLEHLRTAYAKARTLALSPGGTIASYTTEAAAADNEYKAAARSLKASLPPKIVGKIRVASERYKGLQGFLEL